MAGRALPSHLKPSAAEGGEGGFAPRHHGKTQSHVVSYSFSPATIVPLTRVHCGCSRIYDLQALCSFSCSF